MAALEYTYVRIGRFTESGSLAPLQIQANDSASLLSRVGARADYRWHLGGRTLRPEVRVAWQHEFLDTDYPVEARFASGAGNVFRVDGPEIDSDSLLLGAGLSVRWSPQLSTYLYYDGLLASDSYSAHSVTIGLGMVQ
jgi:outer membrane autotransporter protein